MLTLLLMIFEYLTAGSLPSHSDLRSQPGHQQQTIESCYQLWKSNISHFSVVNGTKYLPKTTLHLLKNAPTPALRWTSQLKINNLAYFMDINPKDKAKDWSMFYQRLNLVAMEVSWPLLQFLTKLQTEFSQDYISWSCGSLYNFSTLMESKSVRMLMELWMHLLESDFRHGCHNLIILHTIFRHQPTAQHWINVTSWLIHSMFKVSGFKERLWPRITFLRCLWGLRILCNATLTFLLSNKG